MNYFNNELNEIRSLIEEVSLSLGQEIIWDGGQDGHYYFKDSSKMTDREFQEKRSKLDELSEKVSKFLTENDIQEEDLWQ